MVRFNNQKVDLPKKIAGLVRSYFIGSFRRQEWDGKPWKEVQRRIEGTPEYKYPKKTQLSRRTNPILVGTYKGRSGGTLRRAVNNSIREQNWNTIRLGIDVEYAKYHNEGTDKLAKRQFMGDSKELRKQIKGKLELEIKNIFK